MRLDECGDVLTCQQLVSAENNLVYQELIDEEERPSDETIAICVRQNVKFETGSKAQRLSRKRRSGRRARKRKPGPKGSTSLTWEQVKEVDRLAHEAKRFKKPLNWMLTVRAPDGLSDAKGKRHISTKIAHVGQTLQRQGEEHLGVTVYEKCNTPNGVLLHAHHLFHARPSLRTRLRESHCGGPGSDCFISPADDRKPEYITKQRVWLGPDFEQRIKRRRVTSHRIEGVRLSLTAAAQSLMVSAPSRAQTPIAAYSNSHLTPLPPALPLRFHPHGLFGQLSDQYAPERASRVSPRSRLKYETRYEGQLDLGLGVGSVIQLALQHIGGTHATYATRLGVSRSQATNILNRQFGASRTVVRRAVSLIKAAA